MSYVGVYWLVMAAEIKASNGDRIVWHGDYARRRGDLIEAMSVGEYTFHRTDMFIGVLRFLAGDRDFQIESVRVQIPDNTNGLVKFGHIEFPYEQFVEGVCWLLTQSGKYSQEFHPVRDVAISFAITALAKELKVTVPQPSQGILELVENFEKEHSATQTDSMVWAKL